MRTRGKFTVVGAGPVGALLAILLAKRGYQVNVFEARPDSRKTNSYQGKSINIALSDRGWQSMRLIGVDNRIREDAIPMYGRVIHDEKGNLTHQPYGKKGQAIWSISRASINNRLLTQAEQEPDVSLTFEHKLNSIDFRTAMATFDLTDGSKLDVNADYLFGADGAHSKTRRLAQETPRFSYSQSYMPQCYIELTIPACADGSHRLEPNALHIWPRKKFMLVALPNKDGTFTCTLFLNFNGSPSFESLQDRDAVEYFFNRNFPDVLPYLQNAATEFMGKTASPLFLVQVFPWAINRKVGLIGDAVHAIVPFFGQGMNCGFEDCRVLSELIDSCKHDWDRVFPAFERERKPNCDAIAELSKRNFVEMSDLAGDEKFQLRKKIEARFSSMYPDLWTPLYSLVSFSPGTSYLSALETGDKQDAIMEELMRMPNIESEWKQPHIYETLQKMANDQVRINT